jgi:hypothetical protein
LSSVLVKRSVFCEDDIGDNGFCDTAVTGDGGCGVTGRTLNKLNLKWNPNIGNLC